MIWRCPEHGEVAIKFCEAAACRFRPRALPDPAGYYPGEVWDDEQGDVGLMLDEHTMRRVQEHKKLRTLMTICKTGHGEIVYDETWFTACPLCEAKYEIRRLVQRLRAIEEKDAGNSGLAEQT